MDSHRWKVDGDPWNLNPGSQDIAKKTKLDWCLKDSFFPRSCNHWKIQIWTTNLLRGCAASNDCSSSFQHLLVNECDEISGRNGKSVGEIKRGMSGFGQNQQAVEQKLDGMNQTLEVAELSIEIIRNRSEVAPIVVNSTLYDLADKIKTGCAENWRFICSIYD